MEVLCLAKKPRNCWKQQNTHKISCSSTQSEACCWFLHLWWH